MSMWTFFWVFWRSQNFCSGIEHQDSGYLIFTLPVEELFAGREILPDIHISAKLFDLVPLTNYIQGLPQGYCYHFVCVCVRVCVVCVCVCACV